MALFRELLTMIKLILEFITMLLFFAMLGGWLVIGQALLENQI